MFSFLGDARNDNIRSTISQDSIVQFVYQTYIVYDIVDGVCVSC